VFSKNSFNKLKSKSFYPGTEMIKKKPGKPDLFTLSSCSYQQTWLLNQKKRRAIGSPFFIQYFYA